MIEDIQHLRDTIAPRYLLAEEIGRGGMATVFRARDTKHDRDVAVKVLDPSLGSAIGLERFQREIAIAAALQHPNIVPLYDSGGTGSVLYFIMPLVSGESLRQRMRREAQLPLPDAIAIVRDVAAALAHAHSVGVVHRDIKPENILLSGGKAMVTDFGIARAVNSAGDQVLTELGVALGTPAYMSPEQAGGSEHVDGRADIYALGCVLFEMLSGDPPFTGRTAQALLARHLHETPPSLKVVRPTVSEGLQVAVEKALAKVPADRFTSATAFADAVDAAHIASISGQARVEQVRRRPRALIGVAAAAVLALIAGRVAFGRDPAPDPNRVVVYPLSVPGAAGGAGAGEEVALMIASVLEHTEPLRWLDGQELLGPDRVPDARLLGKEAAKVARRSGARFYLNGALVSNRDSHTVIIRLHDAVADSMVRQESMTGAVATTSAPQLALRAVALILPRLLPPNGRVDVSYLADRNPAAVADWLQGEREYNRSRYTSAMRHLNRALSRDSSLGVAALRGALAATYLQDYPSTRSLLAIAFRHETQMPRHHLALARGLRHFVAGQSDSALRALREASAIDSTWSEPWMLTAETQLHLMTPASDSAIEQSLTTALRLQPGFAPALFHLIDFPTRRGDARRARAILRQIEAAAPDSDVTFQVGVMVRCVFDGPNTIDWRDAVRRASKDIVDLARVLAGGGVNTACARRALESVLTFDTDTSASHSIFRWSALKGLNYLAMLEGRDSAARALLDSASGAGIRAAVSLHVFNAALGSRVSNPPADSAIATLMTMPINRMLSNRLRYLSLWSWSRGDSVRLDSVARRIEVVADSTGLGTDRLVLDATQARVALLRGDTATAIARLKGLQPAADPAFITWDPWESAAGERLLLARLQMATGDAAGAWETAATFDSPRSQVDALYLAGSLHVRLRAARRLGRNADRSRIEARLRALGREDLLTTESAT